MPADQKWATMRDVAAAAGVAAITVSRVLRTPDRVRPETRARVEAAMQALGYVPDDAAGALSSRQSRMVGAAVSTLGGASVFAETVDGLSDALRTAGRQLLLASADYAPEMEETIVAALLARRPEGVVLTSTEHTARTTALLRSAGAPVVEVWELPEQPIDRAVGFSNLAAGRSMTEHLIARGRRRIGFIADAPPEPRGRRRREGYAGAIEAAGLGPPRVIEADDGVRGVEAGAAGLATALTRWPDIDAVFCVSDGVALGALCEARRRGVAVPETLAIAGFGDVEFAGEAGLGLTTVRTPGRAIGAAAAAMILGANGAEDGPKTLDLGVEIAARATT